MAVNGKSTLSKISAPAVAHVQYNAQSIVEPQGRTNHSIQSARRDFTLAVPFFSTLTRTNALPQVDWQQSTTRKHSVCYVIDRCFQFSMFQNIKSFIAKTCNIASPFGNCSGRPAWSPPQAFRQQNQQTSHQQNIAKAMWPAAFNKDSVIYQWMNIQWSNPTKTHHLLPRPAVNSFHQTCQQVD